MLLRKIKYSIRCQDGVLPTNVDDVEKSIIGRMRGEFFIKFLVSLLFFSAFLPVICHSLCNSTDLKVNYVV